MLSIVPGAPDAGKAPKPSKSVFAGARKLVQSMSGSNAPSKGNGNHAAAPPEGPKKSRTKKPATIEDIDKILERDALDLTNMKREVAETQLTEIARAQAALALIQREYDTIRVANNTKEKEVKSIMDNIRTLQGIGAARNECSDAANGTKHALATECDETVDNLAAELRTLHMQQLMASRLDKEIVEFKSEIATVSVSHDQVKSDLAGLESTLRLCRQEYLESERELENLLSTVKSRKEDREAKMGMMFGIVTESQSSVLKIKKELEGSVDRVEKLVPKGDGHHHHNTYKHNNHEKKHHHDETSSDEDLISSGQFRSSSQIKDVIDRYNSRDIRLQKVLQQDTELRDALVAARRRKEDLSAQLGKTQAKHSMLASSRQVYQEVDMKDAALASALKECNECKEREKRLRHNIESISRSFPRFLTKITKIVHPIPTLDQLPDAVHKLEDEISKLIKTIDTAMLKEATTEDLASLGQQPAGSSNASDGMLSEMDRLQKLPGYDRLQKQLFYNLMTARPDGSDINIRVTLKKAKDHYSSPGKQSRATAMGALFGSDRQNVLDDAAFDEIATITRLNEAKLGEPISDTQAIDRSTIKNISKLVIEKDPNKGRTTAKKPNAPRSSPRGSIRGRLTGR